MKININELREICSQALIRDKFSEEEAGIITDMLIEAELADKSSQGVG